MTLSSDQVSAINKAVEILKAAGVGRAPIDKTTADLLSEVFGPDISNFADQIKNAPISTLLSLLLQLSAGGCDGCQNLFGNIDPNGEIIPEFAGQIYDQRTTGTVWVNLGGGVDDEWTVMALYPIPD